MLSTVGSTLCLTSLAMPRNRNYSRTVWTVDTQRDCQSLEATQLVSSEDSTRTLTSLAHALHLISASLLCPAQGTSRISGASFQGVYVCELFKSRKTPRNHLEALYPHQALRSWWQRKDFRETMTSPALFQVLLPDSSCHVAPRPHSSCESPNCLQRESRVREARLLLLPGRECREWVCALGNTRKMSGTKIELDYTVR